MCGNANLQVTTGHQRQSGLVCQSYVKVSTWYRALKHLQYLVILTSELISCRQTEVENLAARIEGRKAGNAAPERAIRSGVAMVATVNGL